MQKKRNVRHKVLENGGGIRFPSHQNKFKRFIFEKQVLNIAGFIGLEVVLFIHANKRVVSSRAVFVPPIIPQQIHSIFYAAVASSLIALQLWFLTIVSYCYVLIRDKRSLIKFVFNFHVAISNFNWRLTDGGQFKCFPFILITCFSHLIKSEIFGI